MTPERYKLVREIFHTVCEVAPDERAECLDRLCGGDAQLRSEIEDLLAHHESRESEDAFEESQLGIGRALLDPEGGAENRAATAQRIGSYRLLERIGEGGMGVVYKAEQARPRRVVALKIMRRVVGGSALRRFESEAQLLAELRHPGIAEVFEAAVHDDGVEQLPYFAMELIPGARSLTEYAREADLDTRSRLILFATVCDAVQHGHQHGVIHRDLKPDNILVDDAGRPKVIDFGVARVARLDGQDASATGTGHIIGTLAYMSPEQIDGAARTIDTRADVYALGVILYELLAGDPPLEVRDKSLPEACRIIRDQEPPLLGAARQELRGDIELIAARAIEKDRERRYASAGELAADIRRHLADEPILARPPTVLYQLRKFARRNTALVAGVAATALSLIAGLIAATTLAVSATHARDEALRETYRAGISAAASAVENHDVALARRSLEMAPPALREWEWDHLFSRLDESLVVIRSTGVPAGAQPWFRQTPGGPAVLLATNDGLRAWNAATGEAGPAAGGRGGLFAQDHSGEFRVTLSMGTLDGVGSNGRFTIDLRQRGLASDTVTRLAISDGGEFVALIAGSTAWRLNLADGSLATIAIDNRGTAVDGLAVTRAGTVILASAIRGRPAVWIPGRELADLEDAPSFARAVDVSPDGSRIVVGLQDTNVGLYDADSRTLLASGRGHAHAVTGVAFSADGGLIASVSLDRTVRLWEPETLEPLATLHGHDRGVSSVVFAPDGRRLATSGEDDTVRIWDATKRFGPNVLAGHSGFVFAVAFSADGRLLASAGWDHSVRIWDARTGEPLRQLEVSVPVVTALSFGSGGRWLAWVGGGSFGAYDLETGDPIAAPESAPQPEDVTVKRFELLEGTALLPLPWTFDHDSVTVWNLDKRTIESRPLSSLSGARADFLSFDGQYAVGLARSADVGDVRAADRDSGTPLSIVDLSSGDPVSLTRFSGPFALSPIRETAVIAARRADDLTRVEVWDIGAQRRLGVLVGHTDDVYAIAYSPDGKRIATAGRDSLRLWDAHTFSEIVQLRGHRSFVWTLAFSPDGSQLASGSGDRTVRLWNTASGGGPPSSRSGSLSARLRP